MSVSISMYRLVRTARYLCAMLAFSMGATPAGAADIRVFSGGAPQAVLQSLAPKFEKAAGHRIEFTFALVTEIRQKLAAGEQADVILLPAPLMAATAKTLPLSAAGRRNLARVGIGVLIRDGAARPDISTAESVRKVLLEARSVALPNASTPSGIHLTKVLEQMGIADEMKPKLIHKGAFNGGGELVAKGDAELGLYLVSEIQKIKGVSVVGLLPPAVQNFVVYSIAIPAYNPAPDPALAFIHFLSEPANVERWQASGFEVVDNGG